MNQAQTSLADCYKRVKAAHDYLAYQGRLALEKAWQVEPIEQWGSQVKRIRVMLPAANRPAAVPADISDHSLIEVINQFTAQATDPELVKRLSAILLLS